MNVLINNSLSIRKYGLFCIYVTRHILFTCTKEVSMKCYLKFIFLMILPRTYVNKPIDSQLNCIFKRQLLLFLLVFVEYDNNRAKKRYIQYKERLKTKPTKDDGDRGRYFNRRL